VPVRIHGEHGRDVGDLDGNNRTYQYLRRLHRPFVHHYVALSRDLADYLVQKIGVSRSRITQAYNGVDISKFSPIGDGAQYLVGCPFNPAEHFMVGTVGRMQTVKDQTLLARAFVIALQTAPELTSHVRLVMVGDGPLRAEAQNILYAAGVSHLAWLPGARDDVAAVMQGLSCFVLPSLAEGISNTILEAMASGLPVIATGVGGNADLVADGETGQIVPASDPQTMAQSLIRFATSAAQSRSMGLAGRERVVQRFSMQAMVNTYQRVYDEQLGRGRCP
jgi:sugar transferase (PEP-CTERM/EpsH1 system associated)